MTQQNGPTPGNELAISSRDLQLRSARDGMEPGARPAAIIPRDFMEAQAMCAALAAANLVPKSFRGNPADMLLVVMTGLEVGLPPMASLRLYTTWDGVPRLMAEGVRAVILHSPEIEYFEPASCSDTEATWIGKRRGRPEKTATWTIARAQKAGLSGKENWTKYPQDMLNARASMQLGRMIAPDVVAGMIALEEARDGDFIEAQFTEKPGFVAPPPALIAKGSDTPEVRAAIAQIKSQAPPVAIQSSGSTEPARRGPGRPTKDKPADPMPSPASSSGGASTSASSTAPSPAPSTPSTAPSQSTASPPSAQPSNSSPTVVTSRDSNGFDNPTSAASNTTPSPSVASAETSSAESGAEFGGEDLPDSEPAQAPNWRTDFSAWLASCANQRDLIAGLPRWREFSKDQFKNGDKSFAGANPGPIGENTKWMQDAYGKRKGEVPA